MKKKVVAGLILSFLFLNNIFPIYAQNECYPSLGELYLNKDKYEKFNRKIFKFNLVMNKLVAKNVHILWATLFPEFLINSMNRVYTNIEYPKRLVSSILQKDKEAIKNETKRFLINTTLGLGGIFDAAQKLFKLEMFDEDMEQALAKCKIKCGSYLVLPFISSVTSRDITGRILDFLLTPTTYIATPITAAIKMGLLINRTIKIQPMIKMVESNFPDPYEVAKKIYGVEKYIKLSNLDRKSEIEKFKNDYDEIDLVDNKTQENLSVKAKVGENENLILNETPISKLKADIILDNYNPQFPILDSMRTALLDIKAQSKPVWHDIALQNRTFAKRLKTAKIEVSPDREKYSVRYILQKDKNSPLAVLFPSVGEGVNNSHSSILAKVFYDEGYSVLVLGSHFQWEFLKSIEKGYKLGLISNDIKFVNLLIDNSIDYLSKKYNRNFLNRVAFGTSLGAHTVLFIAQNQYETGANNFDKFIAVCPPYELLYAINEMDKIIESWKNYPNDFAKKAGLTVAKVMSAYKNRSELNKDFKTLPFSNYEAKLISAFVFHQKLSDLVYTIEKEENPELTENEIYNKIYDMNFLKYMKKYFLADEASFDEINKKTSLISVSNYFKNSSNYRIFHSLDDYLIDKDKLRILKNDCKDKLTLFSNGSHLGFMYRDEFIEALKQEIRLK